MLTMSEIWNRMVSNRVWNDNGSKPCMLKEMTITRSIKQNSKTNAKQSDETRPKT